MISMNKTTFRIISKRALSEKKTHPINTNVFENLKPLAQRIGFSLEALLLIQNYLAVAEERREKDDGQGEDTSDNHNTHDLRENF